MSKHKRRLRIALLVVPLLACGGLAAALVVGLAPSPGCAFPATGPAASGTSMRTVTSGGLKRCYTLYVPPGSPPGQPLPVVIGFHGFAGTARNLRSLAHWERLADQEPFLVVYPEGSGWPLRWNTGPVARSTVDDVQFVRDLLADLEHITAVDKARVYITGFSNGAALAHQVACQMSDRVTAVGLVSGLGPDPASGCHPAEPVPVIVFTGQGDPLAGMAYKPAWLWNLVLHIDVSRVEPEAPMAEAMGRWADRNGCGPLPESSLLPGGAGTGAHWTGCQGGADVVWYTLPGGGHNWPGGSSIPLLGDASPEVDASAMMWEFFKTHPHP